MCGRFTLTIDPGDLREELDLGPIVADWHPRYNIAPTQPLAVVIDAVQRQVEAYRWGLVPGWAKDLEFGSRLINARSETLAEKPSFKNAFARRRCLILADGFFEWKKPGLPSERKVPYYIRMATGKPFTFAGLWESWKSPAGEEIRTCTIITCGPNERVAAIHDRMPVILPGEVRWKWLNPAANLVELGQMLAPFPADQMVAYPVGSAVNSPGNDSPVCVQPL
jgi:putative SOS response-associated peptidase YedK